MRLAGLLTAVAIASVAIAQPVYSEEVPTFDLSATQVRLQGESEAKLRIDNERQRAEFNTELARSLYEIGQTKTFAQPVQAEFERRVFNLEHRPFTPDPVRDLPSNFRR
jgi:hypothetical protein